LVILALGIPLGVALFAALPPPPGRLAVRSDDRARGEAARGGATGGVEGEERAGEDVARTGSRTGRRSAFAPSLRQDPRVVLRVRVGEGERGPEPLLLRGETYDVFDGRAWTRSTAAEAGNEIVPPRPGGWGFVSSGPAAERVVRVRTEDLAGAAPGALPLLAEARRVRLLDGLEDAPMRRRGDGAVALAATRSVGAAWETEVAPDRPPRERLASRRSSAEVAPLLTYVQAPPEADALRALAREVTAGAVTAAEQAARLEAWMRGPTFRYALELKVDRSRPVADFVLRGRSGHCWCFASAMTAMMRSLGRPARLALGYRGGDWQDTLREWAVRGTNAHAWCEVWFEGAGWIVYDPTPAAGATTTETTGEEGRGVLARLARFSADDRRWFRERLEELAAQAAGAAVRPAVWAAAVVCAAVGALVLSRRRRARGAAASVGAGPDGPYGRALAALAAAGFARRSAETPAELGRRVGGARPPVAPPLDDLTRLHEAARYGGVEPEVGRMDRAADAVVERLRATPPPSAAVREAPPPG
jgi:transglutaminase-like putative cysteine protease